MRTRILAGLCGVLAAGCLFVRADDTPAQASARAALEREFYQLDHASAQSSQTNAIVTDSGSAQSTVNASRTPATNASVARRIPPTPATNQVSVAPAEAVPIATVPPGDTATQVAAFAALRQKMDELNAAANQSSSNTKSVETPVRTPAIAPAPDASVAAAPITETPSAEAPAARTPTTASAALSPVSSAPAVVAPVPKASTVAAATEVPAVNRAPDAVPGSVALKTAAPATATPATIGLPKSLPGQARPTNELVTTSGTIYKNVEVERVTADGIFISYTPAQGGWAMTKVPFEDLPAEIRQLYQK